MTFEDHVAEHIAEHNRIRQRRRRRPLSDAEMQGIRDQLQRAWNERQRKAELTAFASDRRIMLGKRPGDCINPEGEELLMPVEERP